ncbi:hypothetical protein [Undibacterium sp. TS12]|uniref:hypothetical protein n=1 Tax=Undibacterium sp. TS12 TaxID=2908202 RepID=UPI001F4CE6FA|nr:hypothetical protein [Undibacterium sp. TS12]MCH8622989.1 hypothetical protein [Undibacterium sp. TS12]
MKTSQFFKCALSAAILFAASSTVLAHDYDGRWHRPAPYPAPYEVVRNYNYIYYPAQQIYYSPDFGAWYWANGRGWETSTSLPYFLNVDLRYGGVPIVLRSPRPYVEHVYVEQTWGRPWRDSHIARQEWREERREHHHHHYWRP